MNDSMPPSPRRHAMTRLLAAATVPVGRAALGSVGGLTAWATGSAAHAQSWPARPLSLVVAYAPGGATDIVARLLAQELSTGLGQQVVVENKAGGGTVVGTQAVKNAAPDGHTLFFGTNAYVINSLINKPVPWDPVRDFEPVSMVTLQSLGVMVRPGLKISSLPALIAYARAHPGKLNFASSGNGSAQHLAGEAFRTAAGIDMVHVPYKGAGPALQDLIGGQVDLMFTSLVGLMDYVRDRRLLLLATTGRERLAITPDVPTVAESGLAGYDVQTWQAVFAPARTPRPIIDRLNAEVQRVVKSGALTKRLADQGMDLRPGTPEELRAHVQRELETYTRIMKTVSLQ